MRYEKVQVNLEYRSHCIDIGPLYIQYQLQCVRLTVELMYHSLYAF